VLSLLVSEAIALCATAYIHHSRQADQSGVGLRYYFVNDDSREIRSGSGAAAGRRYSCLLTGSKPTLF
jgi:hypothetical protein